jgi:D-alanyl-D-alanine carboxypeptidase/D-alanyl-D-alanine-endopeptidase (penicillin-binding protein 4)
MRKATVACGSAAVSLWLTACGAATPVIVTPGAGSSSPVARLRRDIDRLLSEPALARGTWAVVVRSLDRDDTLYSLNAAKLLLPASNMKILTLAAAAERLGWDFTFTTELVATGPIDAGVLDGDLVVVGTGDPSLDDWDGRATRLFTDWADQLKAAGVTTIAGRLVGDDNYFDDQMLGPGWAWDDLDKSFATSVGALQFNQNTARLAIDPAGVVGAQAAVSVSPPGSGLIIRNQLMTVAADAPIAIESRRAAGGSVLDLRGAVPLGAATLMRNASVANPTDYFLAALREGLVAAGIEIHGPAIDVDDLASAPPLDRRRVLVSYRSPPLSELARTMMKLSQNLFAESLLRAIEKSAVAGRDGQVLDGADAMRAVVEQLGVEETDLVVADGSGLSRYNLATARALVATLVHVYEDDGLRGPFEEALPVAGRDGTLGFRMRGTPAEGNARAKTGALSNARALSGYVRGADGEPLVFAIVANNYGSTAEVIDQTTDEIVIRLAQFER